MRRIMAWMVAAALCGCKTYVPEVKESLKCEVSPALLAACGGPAEIREGITFGQMIEVSARDRDALRECAARQQGLARAFATCSDSIEAYNKRIQEMSATR